MDDLEDEREDNRQRTSSFPTVICKKLCGKHLKKFLKLSHENATWLCMPLYKLISIESSNRTDSRCKNKEGMGLQMSHRRSSAPQDCVQTMVQILPDAAVPEPRAPAAVP